MSDNGEQNPFEPYTGEHRAWEEVTELLSHVGDAMTHILDLAPKVTPAVALDLNSISNVLAQAGGHLIEVRDGIGQPDYPWWPPDPEPEDGEGE